MFNNAKKLCTDCDTARKFRDSEQLWFWFLSCRQKDRIAALSFQQMRRRTTIHNPYPCEALDVETLITRLFLSGKITAEQLEVLKEFGDCRRAPNQHVWAENQKAALWSDAMRTIDIEATKKGWMG